MVCKIIIKKTNTQNINSTMKQDDTIQDLVKDEIVEKQTSQS